MFDDDLKNFYVPPNVKVDALHGNGKLLSELEIKKLTNDLVEKPCGRYSKKELKLPYGIIKGERGIYAIYHKDKKNHEDKKSNPAIASGGFGQIKYAQNLQTGEWLALKTIREKDAEGVLWYSEACYDKELSNLTAFGQCDPAKIIRHSKKDGVRKYNILMKLAKGRPVFELHRDWVLREGDPQAWPQLLWIEMALQIVQTIQAIRKRGYLHLDISLNNFLYDLASDKTTAVDFACASKIVTRDGQAVADMTSRVGTPIYWAPEIHRRGHGPIYTAKSEIYALGVILDQLLMCVGYRFNAKFQLLKDFCLPRRLDLAGNYSLIKFINLMQRSKSWERPSLDQTMRMLIALKNREEKNPENREAVDRIKQQAAAQEVARLDRAKRAVQIKRNQHHFAQRKHYARVAYTREVIQLAISQYEQRRNKIPFGLFWLGASDQTLHFIGELKLVTAANDYYYKKLALSPYEIHQWVEHYIEHNPGKAFARALVAARKTLDDVSHEVVEQPQPFCLSKVNNL